MKEGNLIKLLTALSIICAFDFMIVALVFIEIPEGNKDMILHTIGMIDGAFVGSLVGYYYTKSHNGSDGGELNK